MNIARIQLQLSKILAQGQGVDDVVGPILDLLCSVKNVQLSVWYQPDQSQTFQIYEKKANDGYADDQRQSLSPALKIPLHGRGDKILALIECFSSAQMELSSDWLLLGESMGLQVGQYLQNLLDKQRQEDTANLFAMFSQQTNEAFWVCSPRFDKLFYMSPTFRNILGRDLAAFYDDINVYLQYIHPEDRHVVQDAARRVKHFPEGLDVDYRIILPDSSIRWIAARWMPMFDKDGKVDKVCGFARDFTRQKEAEARVVEFYSTVSHELRTPLTSIKGALSVVNSGLLGELDEGSAELIEIAAMETERLIRLINGFLDLRKIELGKSELHLASVPAGELVESVLTTLRPLADESGVSFKGNVRCKIAVKCDKDRIVQVLTNLISNALKFSQKGQTIEVTCQTLADAVRFEVRDQGPGISEEDMKRLFTIFQQIDCEITRQTGGSGLGLAISKSLVEMHGGSIGVTSTVGSGSTFWFELPQQATVRSSYGSLIQ